MKDTLLQHMITETVDPVHQDDPAVEIGAWMARN